MDKWYWHEKKINKNGDLIKIKNGELLKQLKIY
jgi:hypothetical protein